MTAKLHCLSDMQLTGYATYVQIDCHFPPLTLKQLISYLTLVPLDC